MPERCVVYGCSNTTDKENDIFLYQIPFWDKAHFPGIQSPTGAHFFNELASLSPVISVTKRLTKKLNHNLLTNFFSSI